MNPLSIEVIFKALQFAADKHRLQKRKDSQGSPYINHPIEVANILIECGETADQDVLVAAILHDTIEDTETTVDEIRSTFGEQVANLVLECTDDKSLPKAVRKQLQIENAPHKSVAAKKIKIADKTSNVRDIAAAPPADWSSERKREYLEWSHSVVAGLRGVNPKLEALYDSELNRAVSELD